MASKTQGAPRRTAAGRKSPHPKSSPPSHAQDPVPADTVALVAGKGSKSSGGGPGGSYWHIHVGEQRAGKIFINVIDESPLGQHASIQIFLNQRSQGRRIGRVAYRLACEACGHDTVYAHMRKSNVASRRAAEEAGFVADETPGHTQLVMVWRRG